MNLQDIIAQHPESVALIFLKYNIQRNPSDVKALESAMIVHGEPFLEDLANHIANGYEQFIGGDGSKKVAKKSRKKTKRAVAKAKLQSATATQSNLSPAAKEFELKRPDKTPAVLLTHDEVAELKTDLKDPQEPFKREIKANVKKGLGETLAGIFTAIGGAAGKVNEVVDNVKGKPGGGETAGTSNSGGVDQPDKDNNKMLIIAIVVVVVMLVILFATSNNQPQKITK